MYWRLTIFTILIRAQAKFETALTAKLLIEDEEAVIAAAAAAAAAKLAKDAALMVASSWSMKPVSESEGQSLDFNAAHFLKSELRSLTNIESASTSLREDYQTQIPVESLFLNLLILSPQMRSFNS